MKEATTMVVVGADVHKHTHTFVAVDPVGKQVGQVTVAATSKGHAKALGWARREFGEDLRWAVEDCRHLSTRLERDLLSAGQSVVRVPPKMMAEQRRVARTRGKSDPIDALAVARAFLREPDLPVATHDEVSREAKLLTDRRDALVATRTRTINSLLWRVHELDPAMAPAPRSLDRAVTQQALHAWLGTLSGIVAEMARDELEDVIALTARIDVFGKRLGALVRREVPELLALPGCGELSAAKLLGESAGITRFSTEARFARHGGLAPIPVWSGNTAGRVRMTRSGNRQVNCAVHRIAITQIRLKDSLGRAYYDKKLAEGKTRTEALRCLKRRIARTVFNRLTTDHHNRQTPALPATA
ncbi:IS110 family transposase [Phycicoccus sp. CSK15P-2]|uniref:IS110 family transposase n=1 Tax=Phycicoccus sp. CSK15P-2 TaxID=2807627 RepID=UPI0027DD9A99|nr:IS110 family transposase [Phycicoccus sp. CSK15P-2]